MKIGDSLLPCFWWIPVANDESGAWQSYWMRMDPGARSPQHIHESTELLLVTQGVFTDGDNESYGPGEIVVYAAGSDHSSYSTEGCIALVVTRTSSRLLK
ncbi:anti-Sigm factor, ChrR [Pandoraea terrae]|uniref:Anti-Sigm factor, ChrR n=2 Tax=Pandoraea terrae TaxID=1537710 RepID=A0A5E4UYB3_9BURK|nr:anti-Sigm factor, ChrR [Pandoraea terrae]